MPLPLSGRNSCRLLAVALALHAASNAAAVSQAGLVINLAPADPPGTAPVLTGGGNLPDIMSAAAAFWMAAFPDVDWTVDVQYQWGGTGLKAQFISTGARDGHITSGIIYFNNDRESWYADPDPLRVAAYGAPEQTSQDYNGNPLNIGRAWVAPVGSPAYGHLDLLMLATHELGHALGLDNRLNLPQDIFISPEISPEFSGYHVFLTSMLDHIEGVGPPLMAPGFEMHESVRKGISALDILTIAEINGWANPNLDPYAVPEPPSASVALVLAGIFAACAFRRRGRHHA